jgi:formate hydrogenlyase subunit 6/NADH:ubiquinone oxidoreductase subunit I
MKNSLPKIDREKCIRCFCCQEFCPKGAMRVHRTFVARLINR